MGYYELYNHSASSGGELYHHGVKGQKWGVRRQEKRAANRKARAKKAKERIKNSGGSKKSWRWLSSVHWSELAC